MSGPSEYPVASILLKQPADDDDEITPKKVLIIYPTQTTLIALPKSLVKVLGQAPSL